MAEIVDDEYYMEMPTDFDYRVMEGIVRDCSQADSEWEGIVYEYNRKEKIISFKGVMHLYPLYPDTCLRFIMEISKKLDSCAESMEEIREQLMNVEFEVTAREEDSNCYVQQYRVERKNGRATILDGSGNTSSCRNTWDFKSYEDFLEEMEYKKIRDDDRPIDVICREIWPEGLNNPYWEYWENDYGVYIHGAPPELKWGEVGDLYQLAEYDNIMDYVNDVEFNDRIIKETIMKIQTENDEDYKIVQDWCKNFEKGKNIPEIYCQPNVTDHIISYCKLNVSERKAEAIFKGFARYCVDQKVSDKIEMSFLITFDNSDVEYQLLYELKDGEATERISSWDGDEDLFELLDELLSDYGFEEKAHELNKMFSDYLSGDLSEDDFEKKLGQYAEWIKDKLDDYDQERIYNANLTEEEKESRLIMWRENPDYEEEVYKVEFLK